MLDGVRSRRDLLFGLFAVLAAVFIYSLVVHKQIPLSGLAGGGMEFRHRISEWTGRHPNDLAQDLAAMFWSLIAFAQVRLASRRWRYVALGAAAVMLIALGHTHSRSGLLAFVAAGLVVGVLTRSGRILACLFGAAVGVILFAPSITERMLEGFDRSGIGSHDTAVITAGRDIIWPAAIHGISEQPLLGYGRYGYITSAALHRSFATGGGEMHPHNGFLEAALDHGVIGAAVILAPVVYLLFTGLTLFRKRRDPLLKWAGLVGVSTATAALVAGFGGQHFVLYENYWVFWCCCGLVVRARTFPDHSTYRPAGDRLVPAVKEALAP
ncbi:MAG: O-antigen ligase family protein [Planctomycetes bacterium]|nr:O-antigen ligase family protein [Planctomycetota bacterium]